ncbi:MAG TPA: PIN domain-containing protein, partial [Tepidisphaeraceae bacterium]|nr:PIN domain-containing protein [Tepidisphaeraceae bacterium]
GKLIDLSTWDSSQPIYISVIVVSELLMGVHRANSEERKLRRSAFVEAIISGVTILDFTIDAARIHSRIHADLATSGQLIGAHDMMIAATALAFDCALLTNNVREFSRVANLRVIPFSDSGI